MIKNILIVRNDHIGDVVLSTPVFRELKQQFKNVKITVITSKTTKELLETNPYIDELWELDLPKHNLKSLKEYLRMSNQIRKKNFEIGIDLRGSLQISFFLLWLSGIKKIVGKTDNYHNIFLNWLTSIFQTDPIKTGYYTNTRHITEENLFIINKGLGINLKNNWPEIFTKKEDRKKVDNFLKQNKIKEYICIFPFTDSPSKQWPIENFQEILKWLKNINKDIVLVGTKNHREELEKLAKFNPKCKIATNFNLRELCVLFKKSNFVLAHDGGPFHIAWTVKAKTIELVRPFPPELAAGKFKALWNSQVIWSNDENIKNINIDNVKKAIKNALDIK